MNRRLNKIRSLQQHDETWEGTSRLGRMWITPRDKPPYRPYVSMFSSDTGAILRNSVLDGPPTPDQMFEEILRAMRRPVLGAGRARRPSVIYLDNPEHVAALAPRLAGLDVRCEFRRSLPVIEDTLHEMETRINGCESPPGLLKLPSVTPPLVGHLYELAADFFRAAPWHWLNDNHPMAIQYPPDGKPRYAVVMGSGGQVFGLAVYDTVDDLRLMFQHDLSSQQVVQRATWLVLFFEEAMALTFDDLDAMEKYGWTVDAENAYPLFGRTTHTGEIVPPARADVFWLEGALDGILSYLQNHKHVQPSIARPVDVTLSVTTVSGEAQVRLRLPAFERLGGEL